MADNQSSRVPVLKDALESFSPKTAIGSLLRSKDWEKVPTGLRNSAQFSAAVTSARLLQTVQDRIKGQLAQQRERLANGQQAVFGRSDFIDEIRSIARDEGIDTRIAGEARGGMTDIESIPRLGLIYDTQTAMAQGFARWKLDNSEGALLLYPAARFERTEDRGDPRPPEFWPDRWRSAGAQVGWKDALMEPMVALKTSPIWAALSVFGNPYPPFDFQSGWGMAEVEYDEAVSLGLLKEGQVPEPTPEQEFTDNLQASTKNMPQALVDQVKQMFGNKVVDGPEFMFWVEDQKPPTGKRSVTPKPAAKVEPVPDNSRPPMITGKMDVLSKETFYARREQEGFERDPFAFVEKMPAKLADKLGDVKWRKMGIDPYTGKPDEGAYYRQADRTITVSGDPKDWNGSEFAVAHEFGHHLHYQLGAVSLNNRTDPKFEAASDNDKLHFTKLFKEKHGEDSILKSTNISTNGRYYFQQYVQQIYAEELQAGGMLEGRRFKGMELKILAAKFADTVSGLFKGKIGYGHKTSYIKAENYGLKEVFAHSFSNETSEDDPVFRKFFPNVTAYMKEVLNDTEPAK